MISAIVYLEIGVFALLFLTLFIGFYKPHLGIKLVSVEFFLFYLISTPFVGANVLGLLEVSSLETDGSIASSGEAIVVLGGDLRNGAAGQGQADLGPLSLERALAASRLQRRTGLPVLVSGGKTRGSEVTVADTLRAVLETDFGVPVRWMEQRSRNTYENAVFSAGLLEGEGIERVHIVTHRWHLPRAVQAFEHAGLFVVPSVVAPTFSQAGYALADFLPSVRGLAQSSFAFHEFVGQLWYWLKYY